MGLHDGEIKMSEVDDSNGGLCTSAGPCETERPGLFGECQVVWSREKDANKTSIK